MAQEYTPEDFLQLLAGSEITLPEELTPEEERRLLERLEDPRSINEDLTEIVAVCANLKESLQKLYEHGDALLNMERAQLWACGYLGHEVPPDLHGRIERLTHAQESCKFHIEIGIPTLLAWGLTVLSDNAIYGMRKLHEKLREADDKLADQRDVSDTAWAILYASR